MAALLKQARVVVVDDEPAVAGLFSQYLAGRFRVDWFTSSPQALDHLRRNRADLLVTDLIMPQLNGLELTGLAKDQHPALKVVMVSGLNPWSWCQGRHPNLALLDAYLAKPVALDDLERCCGQVLQGRRTPPDVRDPWLCVAPAY
ncbi:MAG: response regulator [Desulfarculus sp.]|nr:response regulator [Desulfarculus sp.]